MKFYKRFPGDITIKTGHLTPAEMGCYDRLLDHYYSTEKAVPLDRAYSICRAVTAGDRKACDKVLAEFFERTADGWIQQRTEEEIAEALPRIEAARENGKKGGRPRKDQTQQKPSGFSDETHCESQTDEPAKARQKPESSSLRSEVSKPSASHPPGGGRFPEFWQAWPKSERKQDKAKCAEHWKRHDLDAIADAILADVRTKRGTTKWQEGYIEAPLVYLRGKRWEDGVTPDDGNPGDGVTQWFETAGGIKAKGAELGIPYTSEDECRPFDQYRARVYAKAGHSPRAAA